MKRRFFIQTASGAALVGMAGTGCMTRSLMPEKKHSIREVFGNYWDFPES